MVLVIEDDKAGRDAVALVLELAGYVVITAANGREGVNLFVENQSEIEAVLLDLSMPVMDGEETMKELLKQNPAVKIILTSGYPERDVLNNVTMRQSAGFLQKPYNLHNLVSTVTQVIG